MTFVMNILHGHKAYPDSHQNPTDFIPEKSFFIIKFSKLKLSVDTPFTLTPRFPIKKLE